MILTRRELTAILAVWQSLLTDPGGTRSQTDRVLSLLQEIMFAQGFLPV
jgi:hypothetical protein